MSFVSRPLESLSQWVAPNSKRKGVYTFHEGGMGDQVRLSTKGAHICEIARLGLPVPTGIILSTDVSLQYQNEGKQLNEGLFQSIVEAVKDMEKSTGKHFGATTGMPFVLCVRSGALVSHSEQAHTSIGVPESWKVPGLMTALLGIGLNDAVVENLMLYWEEKASLKAYAHFLMTFGVNILGSPVTLYDGVIQDVALHSTTSSAANGSNKEMEWSETDLRNIIERFKRLQQVPQDVWEQLKLALAKVYDHWFADCATQYRDGLEMYRGSGVAVILHEQVLGGSGVFSTRNPISGEEGLSGCYWVDGSGDKLSMQQFEEQYPEKHRLLCDFKTKLEKRFNDMLDVEFAMNFHGSLWVLSCVEGHRRPMAAVKIAAAMEQEGLLTERKALMKVDPCMLDHLYGDRYMLAHGDYEDNVVGNGSAASDGVVVGKLAFNAQDVMLLRNDAQMTGKSPDACSIVLVTEDCSATDISCIRHCWAVVTLKGNSTSSTSIFCRGLNKVCVTNVSGLRLNHKDGSMCLTSDKEVLRVGDTVTVNGSTGVIYSGAVPLMKLPHDESLTKVKMWADKYRHMHVLSSIKSIADCEVANDSMCDGYGMIDSLYLFSCINEMVRLTRKILLNPVENDRASLSCTLQDFQLEEMIRVLDLLLGGVQGEYRPFLFQLTTNRLLDLLPQSEHDILFMAEDMNLSVADIRSRLLEIQRFNHPGEGVNPLGCNSLSTVFPDMVIMQVKTILKATVHVNQRLQTDQPAVVPCICLPATALVSQASALVRLVNSTAVEVMAELQASTDYTIGLSVVTPQSCEKIDMFLAKNPSITVVVIQSDVLSQLYYGVTKETYENISTASCSTLWQGDTAPIENVCAMDNPFVHADRQGILPMIHRVSTTCHAARQKMSSPASGDGSSVGSASTSTSNPYSFDVLEKWKKQGVTVGVYSEHHVKDPRTIFALQESEVDFLITPPDSIHVTSVAAAQASIKMQEKESSLGYLMTHPRDIPHQLFAAFAPDEAVVPGTIGKTSSSSSPTKHDVFRLSPASSQSSPYTFGNCPFSPTTATTWMDSTTMY